MIYCHQSRSLIICICLGPYVCHTGQILPINLIHETARRSERMDNAALSSTVSYEIPGQVMERVFFARSQDSKQDT